MGYVKEGSKGIGLLFLGIVIILILGGLIGWGIWAITVATSQVRGQGDAIIEENSAENWTAAQARFEELYADIIATDRKIDVAYLALQEDPEDPTLKTNYTGTVNYCLTIVGEYNAEARKFLSEDFRAADLPEQINNNDPDTDCKESLQLPTQ